MSVLPNYYSLLFNAVTDALEQLDRQNIISARDILIRAQQDAEEAYLSEEES